MPIVSLPTLHADQVAAYLARWPDGRKAKRKVIRCGRRWGKTTLGTVIAGDGAAKGEPIGWFAPEHKFIAEAYNEIASILSPIKQASSKVEGVIRTTTGGRVDFWSLENDLAGRSRHYKKIVIDEGAFAKSNMMDLWEKNIEPTLLDFGGTAYVLSNTNGNSPDNFLWRLCNEPAHGFLEYYAPTTKNPNMPLRQAGETEIAYQIRREETFANLRKTRPPLVYAQEYDALFVSWAGVPIFDGDKMLVNGVGVDYPKFCDLIFVVIDSAMKDGKPHDGTGASYWAYSEHVGHKLICLDWDYVQVQGAFLIDWIPGVFERAEELARECHARRGFTAAYIEDANSGSVLLQQCAARGLPAEALPSDLTSAGKDQRALNASSAVFQGQVKFSRYAHEKTLNFKGQERNHMWRQMIDFRIGDKEGYKRSDDLLDTGCYAVAITLGNQEGIV
jgi:hypothetical protein